MRKRAHHCELQLSNYHVCNFQFKTYFGSCVFFEGFRLSARLQGFLQRIFFYSFRYSLLVCFRRCFTLEKSLTTIKLIKKMINISNRSVSCRKITAKNRQEFCRGNFLCPAEKPILARSEEKSKEFACMQHWKAVPFSYLEFFPKEGHSTMIDKHSSSPTSFLSRPS